MSKEISVHRIRDVDLQSELSKSYMDYAMSVIVGRALPDVRDGLKPVHRRVLYAMYDGGYRPDKGYSKCARIVGDVMANYHPHGDTAIYDTLVRLAQHWSMRYPLVDGQGNFGSPGNDGAAAMRYTEARMHSVTMELVRDIDQETVEFEPNYDGRTQEPVILPSRIPNLLLNGSSGIAVGMATNIPPHNLSEVADAALWVLENHDASDEEKLEECIARVQGPDFPTGATIVGRSGIENAYRTGRGSIILRSVVNIEKDSRGRESLVITELPYQVNPDNLKVKIAELVGAGKIADIADLRDDTSDRTGTRIVVVLKEGATAEIVRNNLYKHTQLQDSFGANMLALVNGVPKTLSLNYFIQHWIDHQIEVIVKRTTYLLRKAEERSHILEGHLKALNALDEVIALIRKSKTVEEAKLALIEFLEIDEIQSTAILDMQLRKLAALEHKKIQDEYDDLQKTIDEYRKILISDVKQREIIGNELREIVEKHKDERRTEILPDEHEFSDEDYITEEDVVISISRGGYVKRTKQELYRRQRRGGKGVRGAALREDDIIEHFFVANTHNWILFFSNIGKIHRLKVFQLPETGKGAKGKHVANLLSLKDNEKIVSVLPINDYSQSDYLIIGTKKGKVKKTPLVEYDTNRTTGLYGISLREGDEVVGAKLLNKGQDIIMVSKKGFSVLCGTNDDSFRTMKRTTRGVIGIRFKTSTDSMMTLEVVTENGYLITVTNAGFAKRTKLSTWAKKRRGSKGVRAMRLVSQKGSLAGAVVAEEDSEIFVVSDKGIVIRSSVYDIRPTGRDTMGVSFMKLKEGDEVVAVACTHHFDDEYSDTDNFDADNNSSDDIEA